MSANFEYKQFHTSELDPVSAVADMRVFLPGSPSVVFVWCSPSYDLDTLGRELAVFENTVIVGCTTAGHLGADGYIAGGMAATALYCEHIKASSFLISDVQDPDDEIRDLAEELEDKLAQSNTESGNFGFVLIDGLCGVEESVTSKLYAALGQVPLIGGSAGDDLKFVATHVYHDGRFLQGAATFTFIESQVPVVPFKIQHHALSERKLVVTEAVPETRTVTELNGYPAAQVYLDILGVSAAEATAEDISMNSLALRVGDELFLRSVRLIHEDGRLEFYCAIEKGSVLTLAVAADPVVALEEEMKKLKSRLGKVNFLLVCDCILRRLEYDRKNVGTQMGEHLCGIGVTGFSTYGEQFNSLHVNQTLVGVAFGDFNE